MPTPNLIEIESIYFDGYLEKQKRFKTWDWNKYWFTVEDGQLNYYKDDTLTMGVGLIDLGQSTQIKTINNMPKSHCFEIVMRDRSHIFAAESDPLRDKWVRLLQQAQLLRPRRSSSMMRPRCNSIDEDCTPDQILSLEDLEPPGTPTSPPLTPPTPTSATLPARCTPPWASPPGTPTSPLKHGSPKFRKAANNPQTNSPKFHKAAAAKAPKQFLDQPLFVKGKVLPTGSAPSNQVQLKGIRRLKSESSVTESDSDEQMSDQAYTIRANSIFYVATPDDSDEQCSPVLKRSSPLVNKKSSPIPCKTNSPLLSNNSSSPVLNKHGPPIPPKKSSPVLPNHNSPRAFKKNSPQVEKKVSAQIVNQNNNIVSKAPVMAVKSNKMPVTRTVTGPIIGLANNMNGFSNQRPVSRTTSNHTVVTRAFTARPVSNPAHIARSRPVSGDRPVIENRTSKYQGPSLSTSSGESDSEGSNSSRKLSRLSGTGSTDTTRSKPDLLPSKSSNVGVVMRNNVRSARSMPFGGSFESHRLLSEDSSSSDSDTDVETDKEFGGEDEVFMPSPVAVSSPMFRISPQVKNDAYYEKLYKAIRDPRPVVPVLPYPRLELTFRSAFDDIRLFLANNRTADEIFPVPRKSERGGKAIKKLKKFLQKDS